MSDTEPPTQTNRLLDGLRLDVWLWQARFFKTRSLASRACMSGQIRLRRAAQPEMPVRVDKAAITVRCGDRLIFVQGSQVMDVVILALGARRGPANEAQGLYRATEPDRV